MRKTIGARRAIKLFAILLAVWFVVFLIDFALASHGHDPVFCLSAEYYAEGNKEFLGLFYKIEKTTFVDDNGNDHITYILSPWIFEESQYIFGIGSIVNGK